MTKLYELTEKYLALSELADDPDMPEDALHDTLQGIEGEIEIKAEAMMKVVTNLKSDTTAIDNEIKRLTLRKRLLNNRAESIRNYLKRNMEATGINKISCPFFQVTLTRPRPIVVIVDETEIPEEYIKTTISKAPIKKKILDDLKSGKEVPGAALGESARSLLVK